MNANLNPVKMVEDVETALMVTYAVATPVGKEQIVRPVRMSLCLLISVDPNQDIFYSVFTDIDECGSDPCENGGECIDDLNEYECRCKEGFEGTHCETGGNRKTIILSL